MDPISTFIKNKYTVPPLLSLTIVCKSYSGENNINNQPEMYFVENIFFHQTRN